MKFSVIVAFKNRDQQRVKHFLNSLRWQQQTDFELIFVNQGSDPQVNEWLEPLVATYTFARYTYNHSQGLLWNKSNALNIGIRQVKGEYIVIADVDIIFPKNFFDTVAEHVTPGIFTTYNAYYLPEECKANQVESLFLPGFGHAGIENFIGLCIATKEAFLRINGFDEYYLVWGAEDIDIIYRLELSGEKRIHVSSKETKVFHQWHSSNAPGKPTAWYLTMMNHLFSGERAKNECHTWGNILVSEDRPIMKLIGEKKDGERFTKLEFWEGQVLIFFNSFIKKFYQLTAGEAACLEYKFGKKETKQEVRKKVWKLFGKKPVENEEITRKDIIDFFQYFIGSNRNLLSDYYLKVEEEIIVFYFIKSKG